MKIMCVEWPEALAPGSDTFRDIAAEVAAQSPDILVTNEMPFGAWFWTVPTFDADLAARSVELHEAGLSRLKSLGVPLVISSRPVWAGEKLANEAFALEGDRYHWLHHKHHFPEHPGWFEASWFHAARSGFDVTEIAGLKIGAALCTDLMFNEHSRRYGKAHADLIVVPRATGTAIQNWRTACAMSALVSGSYVVSSNRVGRMTGVDEVFGGVGMAYGPGGMPIVETSGERSMVCFELTPSISAERRRHYPCDVAEQPLLARGA